MMDRIDSLTFAAPIFFHIVRFWFVIRGCDSVSRCQRLNQRPRGAFS
jgi:hypothetical protein